MILHKILKFVSAIAVTSSIGYIAYTSSSTNTPILKLDNIDYSKPNTPNVNLSWAVEIAEEDVFWDTSFESVDQTDIDLVYDSKNGLGTGGQKFDTQVKYHGDYSLYSPKTVPDKGNWVLYPYTTPKNENHVWFNGKSLTANNGEKISISYRLKTTEESRIRVTGHWAYENRLIDSGATVVGNYKKGAKTLKVSTVKPFSFDGKISFSSDPYDNSNINSIRGIDTVNNEITFSAGIRQDIPHGYKLMKKNNVWMFSDASKTINTKNKWELVNVNTSINNSKYINWLDNPSQLRMGIISNDETWVDDLKVGFASKTKVYRNGTKIYEGYNSEFTDTAMDTTAPGTISNINFSTKYLGSNKNLLKIDFNNAIDNGTEYKYYSIGVSRNGVDSSKSNEVVANVKTGIKGYSYTIDKNPNTIPDNTVDLSNNISTVNYETTETGDMYFHIKAIDNSNNAGATIHFKMRVNTPSELNLEASITSPTNQDVTIRATASGSIGVKYIMLPNDVKIYSNTANYTISSNGLYSFLLIDNDDNIISSSIHITNIDKDSPTLEITKNPDIGWSNTDVDISIKAKD